MKAFEYSDGIVFKGVDNFLPKHTFDCGQCFRWNENSDGSFTGVAYKRAVRIYMDENDLYIEGGKIHDEEFWSWYLDLDRDYGAIKERLSEDEILREAIKHGYGIRILSQNMYEMVVSYIISANNRIPMIKKAVENICKRFGEPVEFNGKTHYTFPEPESLLGATVEDLDGCGCGFRSRYIIDTTSEIVKGSADLEAIRKMKTDDAHKELMKLKGIGPKVADCILLFSMAKYDAFPVDIWVKRVMQYFYLAPDVSLKKIRDFGREKFGELSGFAQEYLFYYARDLKGREGLIK